MTALEPAQFQKRAENLKSVNYKTLQCVGDNRKVQIVIEELQPDVMFEDRPELIEAFYRAGLQVMYPDWHPYTSGMERYATPFSHWQEIPDLLQNLSLNN